MADDYQYQALPVPPVPPVGGNASSNSLSTSSPDVPVIPTASYGNITGPFGDPPVDSGSGGSVAPPSTCATDLLANTLSTGAVAFPCTNPSGSISNPGIVLSDGADPATEWLKVQFVDMSLTDDVQIKIQELDVCHMGTPGKRKFVCGNAYAP